MPHETVATQATPALVIYLLDMSVSMNDAVDEDNEETSESKCDLVTRTLTRAIREMVRRSTRGTQPLSRYKVAAYAYNGEIHDVFTQVGLLAAERYLRRSAGDASLPRNREGTR